MTVDSIYTPSVQPINPSRTYAFTFESIGPESIVVSRLDAAGNEYTVSPGDYTLTMFGKSPIYDGGQVVFNSAPPAGMVEVKISRYTPRDQLVDYQPYTSFPAETHEFALDKLTMIAQETGFQYVDGGGGGGEIDPNAYVPVSGTRVGVPMTGSIEMTGFNRQFRAGIIGGGFDNYWVVDLKADGNAAFNLSMNNIYASYNSKGEWLVNTTYDGNTPMNALVTKQYVEDALGGPGADFIPLGGTEANKEVTGIIEFKNTTLGLDYSFGVVEGITDRMSISGGEFVVATGATAATQWWNFNVDGQLIMPNVDYSSANTLAAVTKGYVDDAVAGGGSTNTFVPLAGTDPAYPITGTIQFESVALNRKFSMGIQNIPGFEDSFTIANDGSSGTPSNIRLVTSGVVHSFEPTGLTTQDVDALGDLTVTGGSTFGGGINTNGLINSAGGSFGGNVLINPGTLAVNGPAQASYELSVNGDIYASGGVVAAAVTSSGVINNGNINSDTFTADTVTTGLGATALTRKDYVDFGLASKADANRTITAGSGLTGGGNLQADRTINVGAGDGITVAADTVAVNSTVVRTTGAQTLSSKTLSSPALTGTVNVGSLSTSTSPFAMVQSGGVMYRGPAMSPAASVIAVLNDIADILNLTPAQRTAISAAISTRLES